MWWSKTEIINYLVHYKKNGCPYFLKRHLCFEIIIIYLITVMYCCLGGGGKLDEITLVWNSLDLMEKLGPKELLNTVLNFTFQTLQTKFELV